ncbi:hypothetical protein JK191_12875 [Gluconobacter sphaericus]|uniref:hypothetical protein n=1 Tax=Gluconobacter sphaericus TaxID=574987 RepID=UPI001B8AD63E|nr:hypothetical protein [Gluconobacter sphaericus]MBS1098427.1 hypothetical protein [Gluconobacter sphaericus]
MPETFFDILVKVWENKKIISCALLAIISIYMFIHDVCTNHGFIEAASIAFAIFCLAYKILESDSLVEFIIPEEGNVLSIIGSILFICSISVIIFRSPATDTTLIKAHTNFMEAAEKDHNYKDDELVKNITQYCSIKPYSDINNLAGSLYQENLNRNAEENTGFPFGITERFLSWSYSEETDKCAESSLELYRKNPEDFSPEAKYVDYVKRPISIWHW